MQDNQVRLNPYQKALLKLFGGSKWGYGKSTTARISHTAAEQGNSIFGLNSALNVFNSFANLSQDRLVKYSDYDAMDESSPEVAGSLSLFASEVTAEDPHTRKTLWIDSPDPALAKKLNAFLAALSIEERSWGTCRNLAKHGDCFWLNLFSDKVGGGAWLRSVRWLHPSQVERLEEFHLVGFRAPSLTGIIDPLNDDGVYRPWDFVHGRIMAYDNEDIYGRSYLEEVRKIWKMLQILETMVALAHIQRASDKHIFKVDVTGLSDEEASALLRLWKSRLRKKEFFDTTTQQFKSDFNPVTIQEDLFLPVREGDQSGVDTLQGKDVAQGLIDDLNYFRNKLCAGLGVPRDYLDGTTGGGAFDSKAALVLQDLHFSRKMVRLQRSYKRMVRWLCEIYLFSSEGQVNRNFTVKMTSLSLVADILNEDRWIKKAEVLNSLGPIAEMMGWNKEVWSDFIVREVLHDLPEDMLNQLISGMGETDLPSVTLPPRGVDKKSGGELSSPSVPGVNTNSLLSSLQEDYDSYSIFGEDVESQFADTTLRDAKVEFQRIKESIFTKHPELRRFTTIVDKELKEGMKEEEEE